LRAQGGRLAYSSSKGAKNNHVLTQEQLDWHTNRVRVFAIRRRVVCAEHFAPKGSIAADSRAGGAAEITWGAAPQHISGGAEREQERHFKLG